MDQFEDNGGLFNYNTREYLFSGRLDHRFSDANSVSLTYRYGYDLEENPDVQSLTGFSAGSSIHNYDDDIQGSWYHIFSPRDQNELRIQYDYNHFNVIPNEPGQVGLQIPGFINNLGTNIFLPSLTILRRTEFADNFHDDSRPPHDQIWRQRACFAAITRNPTRSCLGGLYSGRCRESSSVRNSTTSESIRCNRRRSDCRRCTSRVSATPTIPPTRVR